MVLFSSASVAASSDLIPVGSLLASKTVMLYIAYSDLSLIILFTNSGPMPKLSPRVMPIFILLFILYCQFCAIFVALLKRKNQNQYKVMKKFLLTLISLIFVSSFSFAQRSTITKFEGADLRGVIVSGAFDVSIVYGEQTKAEVSFPDAVASKLTFELTDDNCVRMSYGSNAGSFFVSNKNRPRATITLSKLDYVSLAGDAQLMSSGTYSSDKFVMTVSGSASASFVFMECREASISVSGVSRVEDLVITAGELLELSSSGSAKVQLGGLAPRLYVVASSTSVIDVLSFVSPEIEAVVSGTALVKADVSKGAKVISTGMSAFRYIGDGVVSGDGAKRL